MAISISGGSFFKFRTKKYVKRTLPLKHLANLFVIFFVWYFCQFFWGQLWHSPKYSGEGQIPPTTQRYFCTLLLPILGSTMNPPCLPAHGAASKSVVHTNNKIKNSVFLTYCLTVHGCWGWVGVWKTSDLRPCGTPIFFLYALWSCPNDF